MRCISKWPLPGQWGCCWPLGTRMWDWHLCPALLCGYSWNNHNHRLWGLWFPAPNKLWACRFTNSEGNMETHPLLSVLACSFPSSCLIHNRQASQPTAYRAAPGRSVILVPCSHPAQRRCVALNTGLRFWISVMKERRENLAGLFVSRSRPQKGGSGSPLKMLIWACLQRNS